MAFQLSPGVNVSEIDLTNVVPVVATTEGAIGGVFQWGPVNKALLVDSEAKLIQVYGKPTDNNGETWFTAASFLSYGNRLYVSRAASTNTYCAVATTAADANTVNAAAFTVKNQDDFIARQTALSSNTDIQFIAKYPGDLGNTLKIAVCGSAEQYSSNVSTYVNTSFTATGTISANVGSSIGYITVSNTVVLTNTAILAGLQTVSDKLTVGDYIELGNTTIGKQQLKIKAFGAPAITTNTTGGVTGATVPISFDTVYKLSSDYASNNVVRTWEFANQFDTAPGTSYYQQYSSLNTTAKDELHIIIVDEDGRLTGTSGTVLEKFQGVSRSTDAKTVDGAANYYKTVLNNQSAYVWAAYDIAGFTSAPSATITNVAGGVKAFFKSFILGTNGQSESDITISALAQAYDQFQSAETIDISLVMTGKSRGGVNGEQLANYLIDNIAENRKDCVVFLSPDRADVVNNVFGATADDVVQFRNAVRSSSYAVMDSGYKYMYDKYNDVYRYIPLNGDTAGLCARTDQTNDPWWSPAGVNRGNIKNVVRLAFNPTKADRDTLYKNGVNPVVTLPGQGTVLYGDKTLLAKASAFDRINVRRLFIVLEKAIARAAQSTLFEFNDFFTRAQFRNLIEPYLRDVKGRRGIYDFKVVCDETNNTAEVIDTNRFVGDIYIKPARSINYIQLNFVAVRTGVEFSEIIGQ